MYISSSIKVFFNGCNFSLRVFLTAEDEEYENEFHAFMSKRLDEDIKKRKDVLLSLKRDRDEKHRLFVEQKTTQKLL